MASFRLTAATLLTAFPWAQGFLLGPPGARPFSSQPSATQPTTPTRARSLICMSTKGKTSPFVSPEDAKDDIGLKVSPNAWKWPLTWPYTGDYFNRKSTNDVEPSDPACFDSYFDEESTAALAAHFKRFIPEGGRVLELGASTNSYLPADLTLSTHVGIGINQEEMDRNSRLTSRKVQNLNENTKLAYDDASFDVVIMTNTVQFLTKPREVIREAWRCLKPDGLMMVPFASKTNYHEDKQIKMWGTMNDDQRMWIVGSFYYFACNEGFENLKAYDFSADGSKNMLAGLGFSGKTPCHVVQANKARVPTIGDPYKQMMALLWPASYMEVEDKALTVARINADVSRAKDAAEKEQLMKSVTYLPKIYSVLGEMGNALQGRLKALLASNIAINFHDTEVELEQLREGLGLKTPTTEFWKPLGASTMAMSAEDKVLLLGECVPMFAGTPDEQAALKEMIELLPKLMAMIEIICPEMPEGDRQLAGVDMIISDFLHEPKEEREKFLPWVESLQPEDIEAFLAARKSYKNPPRAAAAV